MITPSQELGKWGEQLAADYLSKQGYAILAKNVYTPYGELDLVASLPVETKPEGTRLVFVEVKTRRSRTFGYPEESITANKQEHLISAAQHYLQENPDLDYDWQVDVIAIESYKDREPVIRHFENALHGS